MKSSLNRKGDIVSQIVALLVAVAFCWVSSSPSVGDVPKRAAGGKVISHQETVDRLPWRWSGREASLAYSVARHLTDDEVDILPSPGVRYCLTIRLKAGDKTVQAFEGHEETVLARWGDRLYLADFSPIASGCTVIAVNLKTGERLWQSPLRGLGPVHHSEYHNRVTIATDGTLITVWGKEASGRYVEFLDCKTGKTVGHKVFPEE
jgi:hypothetical protein